MGFSYNENDVISFITQNNNYLFNISINFSNFPIINSICLEKVSRMKIYTK